MQERGFYAADVQLQDRRTEGQGITLRVDTGHPVEVREVVIEGLQAVPEGGCAGVLTKPDTALTRGLLRAAVLEEDLLAIRNLMRGPRPPRRHRGPPRVSLAADGRRRR